MIGETPEGGGIELEHEAAPIRADDGWIGSQSTEQLRTMIAERAPLADLTPPRPKGVKTEVPPPKRGSAPRVAIVDVPSAPWQRHHPMRSFLPLVLLSLAACASDPAITPDASAADAGPCGGACGSGTTCEGGRCVIADGGGTDAPQVDVTDDRSAPQDVGADAGAADAGFDVGAPDVGTDVGFEAEAPDVGTDVGADVPDARDVPADNGGMCRSPADCPRPPNTSPTCFAQSCGYTCFPGSRDDCDGNRANGCEVDSLTDARHCGGCGVVCPAGRICIDGLCVR